MNPAESYILNSPEPYRSMLLHLKTIVECAVPEAQLLYKWRLPFYYVNGSMFCFLNYRKTFLDLGIPNADVLSKQYSRLIAGEKRKSLRSLRFHSMEDIDDEVIIDVLQDLFVSKSSQ